MKKIILLSLFIITIFTGCFKQVETPVYIHSKTPILENYNSDIEYQFGILYNKDNNVCIVKWNTCIPKTEFATLVTYIQTIKTDLSKHQSQVEHYNKWSTENNNK